MPRLVLLLVLASCSTPGRNALPLELAPRALPMGLEGVRHFGDMTSPPLEAMALNALERELEWLDSQGQRGALPPAHFLALSGGGADGAFGAGLLCGWSEAGDRPSFKLVTGISTGALTAPFAFLGPEHDAMLERFFTSIGADDVLRVRGWIEMLWGDALTDSSPLAALIASCVDEKLLAAVAEQYRRGRLLLVGTTDLDSERPVLWDMGAIAASGHPRALELFRTVMLASASIPGAFPPVMIPVVVDGRSYDEMHVDGGTSAQVFVYPPSYDVRGQTTEHGIERERRLYVVRNARISPDHRPVERQTLSVLGRSVGLLIRNQGLGDLFRIYLNALRDGFEVHMAWEPLDFAHPREGEFDTAYMRALFERARTMAREGYPWERYPPGYAPGALEERTQTEP